MTLPGLIDKALQTRFGDQSLRYAVCFSIPQHQQSKLGEARVAEYAPGGTLLPN
jgi:hypothetical protein